MILKYLCTSVAYGISKVDTYSIWFSKLAFH